MPMIIMNIKLLEYINNHKLQYIVEINFNSWSFFYNAFIEMEMIISGYSLRIKN